MGRWTQEDDSRVRDLIAAGSDLQSIARAMGRSRSSIDNRAYKLGIRFPRRPWTPEEDDVVRQHYRTISAAAIAAELGRTKRMVYMRARNLEVACPQKGWTPEMDARLTELNGQGVSDTEVARRLGYDRHHITRRRRALGLPDQSHGLQARKAVSAGVKRQLERLGIPRLTDLRMDSWRRLAAERGWPEVVNGRRVCRRHIAILDTLYLHGPQTRQQIAERIGWRVDRGQRHLLKSNGGGGSYLAELMRAGLVMDLGRCVQMGGRGRNVHLYGLDMAIEKGGSDVG